jgi:hypothetical protein
MKKILIQITVNNFYIKILRCIMNHVIVVSEHTDPMPSEDGHLTETCKGSNYIQIE